MASLGNTDEMSARLRPKRTDLGYSRFVKLMKLVMPLVAMAMIVTLVAWPQFDDGPPRFQPDTTGFVGQGMGGQETGSHRLTNVRFTGADRDRNPYTLTAEAAVQKTPGSDVVTLSRPEADFTTGDGAWVAVSAPRGSFARKQRKIVLEGGVSLFHDSGYGFRTHGATIDFARSTAVSDTEVTGQGPAAHLEAAGFRILRDDGRIEFTGPARVVLFGDPAAARK